MIAPRNVIRHELIGLDVLVVYASNPTLPGCNGRSWYETRNMLAIRTGTGLKRIQKDTERVQIHTSGRDTCRCPGFSVW